MKNIDIQQVAHLYYHEKKSVNEIAEILNCSNRTIYNRMNENGMKRRSYSEAHALRWSRKYPKIVLEEIVYLYFEKKLSLEAIAKQLGRGYTAIRGRLIAAGYRCRKRKGPSPKFTDAESAEMARLYHDEELTPAEIAYQYDSTTPTIISSLRRVPGFRFRTRKEARVLRKKKEELAVSHQRSAVSKEGNLNENLLTDRREVFSQEKTAPTADSHFYTPPKRVGKVVDSIPLLPPEQVTPERILQLCQEDGLLIDDIAVICSLSRVDVYNILQKETP